MKGAAWPPLEEGGTVWEQTTKKAFACIPTKGWQTEKPPPKRLEWENRAFPIEESERPRGEP